MPPHNFCHPALLKKKNTTTVVPEGNMKLRLANRVQEPLNANFVHNMLFHQGAENHE